MDSGLYGLISNFKLTSRKLRLSDSDGIDRANHYHMPIILIVMSLVICAKSYLVGEPLQCWIPQYYQDGWEQYAENYCWIENTEFVPRNKSLHDPKFSEELKYYQWVPFVLVLQAFMFYLPHYIWRMINWMSGIDIHHLMIAGLGSNEVDVEKSEKNMDEFIDLFRDSFMEKQKDSYIGTKSVFLSISYILIKLLYVINVLLQFLLTSAFLRMNFFTLGIRLLYDFSRGIYWNDTGMFPRVTYCTFNIRSTHNVHPNTLQCVLVVNMLIEKVYIAMWFMFIMYFVMNSISFLCWTFWMIFGQKPNQEFDKNRSYNLRIWKYMSKDSLFVLKLLKKNCLGLNYYRFLEKFGETPFVIQI